MIKRGQVFVRAKSPSGIWGNHDILDLTDETFKAYIVDTLLRGGHLLGIKPDLIPGKEIELESKIEEEK